MTQPINTYCITSETYYDNINICYKNIFIINNMPKGPLSEIVRQLHMPEASAFTSSYKRRKCVNAIYRINEETHNNCDNCDKNNLMNPDDIGSLFNFLLQNNYKIDTSLTNMMNKSDVKQTNKLVCFISY